VARGGPPAPGSADGKCSLRGRPVDSTAGARAPDEPKWSLGPIGRGAAVRLAPVGPVLAIAEGIETALTAIVAAGIPAWSAPSARGIQRLVLPTEVIEVSVIADHDRSRVGERCAQVAADKWLSETRRVRIAMPPEADTDLNDVLSGRGKARSEGDNFAA
jgi:hypothetical protein